MTRVALRAKKWDRSKTVRRYMTPLRGMSKRPTIHHRPRDRASFD
jgi:hypothetical protein